MVQGVTKMDINRFSGAWQYWIGGELIAVVTYIVTVTLFCGTSNVSLCHPAPTHPALPPYLPHMYIHSLGPIWGPFAAFLLTSYDMYIHPAFLASSSFFTLPSYLFHSISIPSIHYPSVTFSLLYLNFLLSLPCTVTKMQINQFSYWMDSGKNINKSIFNCMSSEHTWWPNPN